MNKLVQLNPNAGARSSPRLRDDTLGVPRLCDDCNTENPKVFVVHDDLWCWHISGPDTLCLLCAEKRLGRRFTPGDFKPIPANTWAFETLGEGTQPDV